MTTTLKEIRKTAFRIRLESKAAYGHHVFIRRMWKIGYHVFLGRIERRGEAAVRPS